jgi:predicted Zn-dependent protease
MTARPTIRPPRARAWRPGRTLIAAVALALGWGLTLSAAEPGEDAQRELLAGNYDQVIERATAALQGTTDSSEWSPLLVKALLAVGRNTEAQTAMADALKRDPASIRIRWLAREVDFANDHPAAARLRIDEIRRLVETRPWMYRSPAELVIFGRVALQLGADPKDVLDKLYATAQKADPKLRDAYLARGELALDKHDFALAAKAYEEGLKQLPDDPDLEFGRAQAYASGEREAALKALDAALKLNPRHVPSLLQLADHHIDAEEYTEAAKLLDQVIAINPRQPDAWAYRAVLAHLRNDIFTEASARAQALRTWQTNPHVDYLIGEKLAQKYRFAEAATYQNRAIAFDPGYLPASAELANDLLRLGQEDEGWRLAQAVHDKDDYDVEAYNLLTLRDTMAKYATLTNDDFVIRMAAPESTVYGPRVLDLLTRAKATLTAKYGIELARPTYVEIFADQKDFAVRTFGMPDIGGFLGVCFGRVVTANSPATSGHPTNWESVLWHEFCHVVTLQLTQNKMPRWLSEGISVYEERQVDPAWGMHLDAAYRGMIMKDELTPVGSLSAAFLAPKTPEYLQFAYLESSMVVEFIVSRFGVDHLRGVLADLRGGQEINAALAKNVEPLEKLDKEFAAFAHERAERLAAKLDWEKPDPDVLLPGADDELAAWEKKHPDNYWLLKLHAQRFLTEKQWARAKAPLARLVELYPSQKGTDTAYRPLVAALHELGETAEERRVLTTWAAVDDEAPDAYLRLMELAAADKDWPTVTRNAERYLAVNPLVAPPYRYLAQASTETGDLAAAVGAWRTLLQLDPADPADAHFQLAQLLHRRGDTGEARRQTLLALEEAPRYREALHLLAELHQAGNDAAIVLPKLDPVTPGPLLELKKP